MSCNKVWTTALASVAVACMGVLFGLSEPKGLGAVLAVAALVCVTFLWWWAWRIPAGSSGRSVLRRVADAIDVALAGDKADVSGLDAEVAAAVLRVADRISALSGEVAELSPSDELTSLAKEDVFNNVLWREFTRAARYGTPLSVALVEIKGLEGLQGEHARRTASQVTRHVASVILQMVRETDLAARYGDDRFAVIMPETGGDGAREFAQRLGKAVEQAEFKTDGAALKLGVLVGVASVPSQDIKTAPNLVEKAAAALGADKDRA